MKSVEELIAKHEGRRASTYLDSKGIPTIGIGHNLQAVPLPIGWTEPLTDDQIDQLFQVDLAKAKTDINNNMPWVLSLDEVRQAVVIDMAFNLGISKLLGFHNTLWHLRAGAWEAAADEMANSAWAKQVGIRATEDEGMVRTGEWPV